MSVQLSFEMKEVGCDYITATTTAPSFKTGLGAFGVSLLRAENARGHKRRDSRAAGYQTMHAGGISVGVRYDGTILRASGEAAREHWNQIVDLSENVTRFDIQFTGVFKDSPAVTMGQVWRQNCGWTSGAGRRSKVKERSGPTGMESMECGSRQSELFARIYDKWVESQLPWYENCLRWELELKADLAYQYSQALTLRPNPEQEMFNYILDWAKRRLKIRMSAVDCSSQAPTGCERYRLLRVVPDCYRSLKYLELQVAPTIARLVAAGYRKEVLEALGLLGQSELDTESGPEC